MVGSSIEEAQESVIPVEGLDVREYIRHVLEAPCGYCISSVKLALAVHHIWFPVSDHCKRETEDHNDPDSEEKVLERLAEPVALDYDFLDHDHADEGQHQQPLSASQHVSSKDEACSEDPVA